MNDANLSKIMSCRLDLTSFIVVAEIKEIFSDMENLVDGNSLSISRTYLNFI